jgi:Homing endonuclease associated repeat
LPQAGRPFCFPNSNPPEGLFTSMPDKKLILQSIAAVTKQLGRVPSRHEFTSRSGVSLYSVLRSFRKWNDAVRAAGIQPNTMNVRVEDRALLEDWGRAARNNRAIVSLRSRLPVRIYGRDGKYNACTLASRFGGWSRVARAFRNFAKGKEEWADVLEILSGRAAKKGRRPGNGEATLAIPGKSARHPALEGRATYGNPLDFLGLRYEPVNEQGVVLLFGMLAQDLGYLIETVQTGFPDCEALRQIAPERWQRVHIEFEFESRNYREHGHPVTGCDVIVCWRHNWPDCPAHIEVLELSSRIKSLPTSPD